MKEQERSPYLCCYKIQSLERQSRGETQLGKLEECLDCLGYSRKCPDYIPIKQMTGR